MDNGAARAVSTVRMPPGPDLGIDHVHSQLSCGVQPLGRGDCAAALAGDDGAHFSAHLTHARHESLDSQAAWGPPKACVIFAQASADLLEQPEARGVEVRVRPGSGVRPHFVRADGPVDALLAECARFLDLLIDGACTCRNRAGRSRS